MKTLTKKISLQFGAMVPPLAEQLKEYPGIPPETLDRWQSVANCITLLYANGYMQESSKRVLREKLSKEIVHTVEQLA